MNNKKNYKELGRLLYYPYITVSDINWIKYSLLYLDKLEHISPAEFDLNIEYNSVYSNRFEQLDYDITDLVSSIYPSTDDMLSAINYTKNVVDKIKKGYQLCGDRYGALTYDAAYKYAMGDMSVRQRVNRASKIIDIGYRGDISEDEVNNFLGIKLESIKKNKDYTFLYRGKFYNDDINDSFENYCINNNIGFVDEDRAGIFLPKFIGESYMKGLVMKISRDKGLDTITDNDSLFDVYSKTKHRTASIPTLVCKDLLPKNLEQTRLKDIIGLRKSNGFNEMMREFRISIKEYSDMLETGDNIYNYESFENFIANRGRQVLLREIKDQFTGHAIEMGKDFIMFSLAGQVLPDLMPTAIPMIADASVRVGQACKDIYKDTENTRLTKNYMAKLRNINRKKTRRIGDIHLI